MAIRKSITTSLRSSRWLVLLTLMAAALLPSAHRDTSSALVIPTTYAASDCDMAVLDCTAKKNAQLASCLIISGESVTTSDCLFNAQRIYNGCMTAWGCPIGWIAPRSFPGDN